MAEEKIMPDGVRCFPKHANAPAWILASMVLTPNDLITWLKANEHLLTEYQGKKQIRLQILLSKDGKPYCAVDTFKATAKGDQKEDDSSGLPF